MRAPDCECELREIQAVDERPRDLRPSRRWTPSSRKWWRCRGSTSLLIWEFASLAQILRRGMSPDEAHRQVAATAGRRTRASGKRCGTCAGLAIRETLTGDYFPFLERSAGARPAAGAGGRQSGCRARSRDLQRVVTRAFGRDPGVVGRRRSPDLTTSRSMDVHAGGVRQRHGHGCLPAVQRAGVRSGCGSPSAPADPLVRPPRCPFGRQLVVAEAVAAEGGNATLADYAGRVLLLNRSSTRGGSSSAPRTWVFGHCDPIATRPGGSSRPHGETTTSRRR